VNAFVAPWYRAADARSLAMRRLILFWVAWRGFDWGQPEEFAKFGGSSWRGIGIPGLLGFPLLSPSTLSVMAFVATVASALSFFGAAYRFAAPVAAFSAFYFQWIVQSAGKVDHNGLVFLLAVCVMACSRAADAWSVDAWLRKRRGLAAPPPSAEYSWPVRFIAVLVVTMYGAAGLTKLKTTGLAWATSDNLRNLMLAHHFTHHPPTALGVWLANYPTLCHLLAAGALLLEISSPLALFNRYLYRAILPSLALLQFSIYLLLGVFFKHTLVTFACLLPFELLLPSFDRFWAKRFGDSSRTPTPTAEPLVPPT